MAIKKIIIKSRREVEREMSYVKLGVVAKKSPWALISIWTENELVTFTSYSILEEINCQDALSIRFADLTLEELQTLKQKPTEKDAPLFGEPEAIQIIDFVDRVNKANILELVIHCAAGLSRSPAVGLWACKYLKLDEKKFRKENPHILPNIYVLSTLNKVSGLDDEYVKFWATQENLEKRNSILLFKQ